MSSPTIRILRGSSSGTGSGNGSGSGGNQWEVGGYGLALGMVPVDQDAAYWEWHIHLPGKVQRPSPKDEDGDDDDNEEKEKEEGELHNGSGRNVSNYNNDDDQREMEEDPYALKFGVATRKDWTFYKTLESSNDSDESNAKDDGTYLMRPISNLHHGDVVGVAVQQCDLPMIQILVNGEPMTQCTINRFRGVVYPAIYIPPGAATGAGGSTTMTRDRVEDVDNEPQLTVIAEFEEDNFKEMSPHARFGPLLAARGII